MKKSLSSLYIISTAILLSACGGGGGGGDSIATTNTSNAPSTPATVSGPQTIKLAALTIRTNDVLATTASSQKVSVILLDKLDYFAKRSSDMFMGSAYALDQCGTLCQAANPPANVPATQQLTARLTANGTLASLAPVFTSPTASTVKCDFTNVGVKVNSIWWLDMKSQNALVNLSVPTSVDSSCNLTYNTGDYVVFGATSQVVALNQDVISDVSDLIPAGDQGFNSSTNAIYLSKSTGLVRELQIDTNGTVFRVDLTTSTQPTCSRGGAFGGQVAYNGTYLVGNAAGFSGLVIYQKGNTAFKIMRDANQNVVTPCSANVVLNDKNEFLTWQDDAIQLVDPVSGSKAVWSNYAQRPQAVIKLTGRSGTIIGGDRCNYWNYDKATMSTIYAAPSVTTWNLPYTQDMTQMLTPLSVAPRYSRVSEGHAYCVTAQMNRYIRQDLNTGNTVALSLDDVGYVPSSFEVFADRAYVTVTNTKNSNVEYIEVNFATNKVSYLGTISAGGREVVSLMKASNGG